MSSLVFDIEADGLDPTKIWCIVAQDIATNKIYTFEPDNIDAGVDLLLAAEKLIGHNIIGYDIPAIEKLCKVKLSDKKIVDTLVMSRLFNPTREGGHGLEGWGYRLGYAKGDFKEFDAYSPEMLSYCVRDVELNTKVYRSLNLEARNFSRQSMDIEHEVYKIINQQRTNGFLLDLKFATMLVADLNEQLHAAETEVHKTFMPKRIATGLRPVFTKSGQLSKMAEIVGEDSNKKMRLRDDEFEMAKKDPAKIITRVEHEPFNLGSRKQIGEYLIEFGWKPKALTPTGQPIVDEGTLSRIKDIPEARIIARYLMLQKRIAQVSSWITACEDDDRVRGFVNPNGTITGRMTHNSPNMGQVPAIKKDKKTGEYLWGLAGNYGTECRKAWTVPEGKKLVGIDASGLELRMLAHYMNDEAYTYEILNGDIHTSNQNLAGLESRDQAKTFIYALLYGAGDAKLGTVVGGSKRAGAELRQRFFDNLPAFKHLKERVSRAAKRGFIKGLDGRAIYVRSEHAALNTTLQGAGAVVMKVALTLFDQKIKEKGYDAKFVCNVHDEWQMEVAEDQADDVGKLGVAAIRDAGDYLNLRCPLDGEYKTGVAWHETH